MLLIVAHHYTVNSGLLDVMNEQPAAAKSLFLFVFGAWGRMGINCFVLITGYFMCKSNITLRKFLKLLLEVRFYNIVILLVFAATGYATPSVSDCISALFPVRRLTPSNFTGCYLVFFFLLFRFSTSSSAT